jgi:hypothetical protein
MVRINLALINPDLDVMKLVKINTLIFAMILI